MEQRPIRYLGLDVALRGEKSRFVLPSSFRKSVLASSGQNRILCVAPHPNWNCLSAFGTATVDQIELTIEKEIARKTQLGIDFDIEKYMLSMSRIIEVPFDPSGRLVLPEYLAGPCGITTEILLHGGIEKFTLWSPEVFFALEGQEFEGSKPAFRHLLAEAHAGKKK